MPEEWRTGLICPIFKKGDKLNCSNYRGVTLLNVAYKVFSGILQRRLSCYAEEILGEYQCGFRPGRSTTDQIFVMRQSMEKCFEYDIDLHMLFIDFQQAFDSIKRGELLNAMEGFGIPRKLVRLAGLTMRESRSKAFIGGKTSRTFEVSTGMRQGDSLSAVLFNLAPHVAMTELRIGGTIIYRTKQV
jgi:sorting nexin-29